MKGRTVKWLAGVVLAAAGVTVVPVTSGAAGSGTSLQSIRCTSMPTDPALAAPLYAQDEGASAKPDGWWCQLPHATMMPPGFAETSRSVAPVTDLYSTYQTDYGPKAPNGTDGSSSGPQIAVSDDVNSAVTPPKHLKYPPLPKGTTVTLGHKVTAKVYHRGITTTVAWHYPLQGVPAYLHAVAEVTVRGIGMPESVVVGVARHVRPN